MGLPIFESPGVDEGISQGDHISVDQNTGVIINQTTDKRFVASTIPPFMQELIEAGGLMPFVLKRKQP
jgi:3-isopropylmalate dehydratase small subunit